MIEGYQDNNQESLEYLQNALRNFVYNYGPNHINNSYIYQRIGICYRCSNEDEKGLENLLKAKEISDSSGEKDINNLIELYRDIGRQYYFMNQLNKADEYYYQTK